MRRGAQDSEAERQIVDEFCEAAVQFSRESENGFRIHSSPAWPIATAENAVLLGRNGATDAVIRAFGGSRLKTAENRGR